MRGKFVIAIAAAFVMATAAFFVVDPAAAQTRWYGGGGGGGSMHFASPHFGGMGHFGGPRFGGMGHFAAPRFGGMSHFGAPRFGMSHFGHFAAPRYGVRHFAAPRYGVNHFTAPRYGAASRFAPNAMTRNRGAFGYRHGQFAGRHFHRGFVGWAGPVFWPYAYDDLFDYAFWPYGYEPDYDLFWAYGYDDLFAGILLPYNYAGLYNEYGAAQPAAPQPGAPVAASSGARPCVSAQSIAGGVPTDAIAKAVQPNSDQSAKLDALKGAEEGGQKALSASCATQVPSTAVGRLDAVQTRLQAMIQAADVVRTPLDDFYSSLTDEQKAAFNNLGQSQQALKQGAAGQPSLAQLCGPQNAVPVIATDQIEKAVLPDAKQRAALLALRDAATKADNTILATCPSRAPLTPPGRLDAVRARLQAMLQGVQIVRPALQDFYASLSDQQKARFDAYDSAGRVEPAGREGAVTGSADLGVASIDDPAGSRPERWRRTYDF